jgi:hypothetical protein
MGLSTDEGTDDSEVNLAISPALIRKESVDDVHISPELTSDERKQLKEIILILVYPFMPYL